MVLVDQLGIMHGVTVHHDTGRFTIKGKKGEVSRDFAHPMITYKVNGDVIEFHLDKKYTQREKKMINTIKSHLKNAMNGAERGHTYRLKICSGHFPMTVAVKGKTFEVKNLLGEKVPRTRALKEGVHVKVDGDIVTVEGIDLAVVSQTAADIEELTKRPGFDKRVFMDGIWIIEKDGESLR
jgi:large subunit ribosomal protein L6